MSNIPDPTTHHNSCDASPLLALALARLRRRHRITGAVARVVAELAGLGGQAVR